MDKTVQIVFAVVLMVIVFVAYWFSDNDDDMP